MRLPCRGLSPSPLIGWTRMGPNGIVSCEVQTLQGNLNTAVDKLKKCLFNSDKMSIPSRGNRISPIRYFNLCIWKVALSADKCLYLWFSTEIKRLQNFSLSAALCFELWRNKNFRKRIFQRSKAWKEHLVLLVLLVFVSHEETVDDSTALSCIPTSSKCTRIDVKASGYDLVLYVMQLFCLWKWEM